MKRFFAFVILFISILVLTGCSKKAEHPYFNGTVLEIYENSVLVKPFEGSEELKSADQITVSCVVISAQEVPKMEKGTTIRIEYDGSIAESYPAQINHVFAIYLVDADGEIVEGRSGAGTEEEKRELDEASAGESAGNTYVNVDNSNLEDANVAVISDGEIFYPVENLTFSEITEIDKFGKEQTSMGCGRWLEPQDVVGMPQVPYYKDMKAEVRQPWSRITYRFYDENFDSIGDGEKEVKSPDEIIFTQPVSVYYVKMEIAFEFENERSGYQYFFKVVPSGHTPVLNSYKKQIFEDAADAFLRVYEPEFYRPDLRIIQMRYDVMYEERCILLQNCLDVETEKLSKKPQPAGIYPSVRQEEAHSYFEADKSVEIFTGIFGVGLNPAGLKQTEGGLLIGSKDAAKMKFQTEIIDVATDHSFTYLKLSYKGKASDTGQHIRTGTLYMTLREDHQSEGGYTIDLISNQETNG